MQSTPADTCEYCGRRLETYTLPPMFGSPERRITIECECDGAREARRSRYVGRKSDMLHDAWLKTGVPKRYQSVAPDYERAARLTNGSGYYIHGDRGTGKTTLAASILKGYVAKNMSEGGYVSARYVSAPAWLDSIADTFGKWGASAEDAFMRAAGVKVLLIDDLGKLTTRTSPQAVGKLFRLIDLRYSEMRSTIITSRFRLDQLAMRLETQDDQEIAADMISRIFETCERIQMNGQDRRLG